MRKIISSDVPRNVCNGSHNNSNVSNDSKQIRCKRCELSQRALLGYKCSTYMREVAKGLAVTYGKLVHVTYIGHDFHRFWEKEHMLYLNVDKLVTNGKEVFLKSFA